MDGVSMANMQSTAFPLPVADKRDTPNKVREAAQQFEALLMQQMLRTVRESGGWLGSGDDATGECATDFAEQQFAAAMSAGGGLGLARLIAQGLTKA